MLPSRLVLPLLAVLYILSPGAGAAETLEVASRTFTDAQFLAGDVAGAAPVTLTGRLTLPGEAGPYPAVILLHGTDGHNSGASYSWESYLPTIGIATLALDSYTGRGLLTASSDQDAFGQFNQIHDAYRAADVLAGHPGVDPERIAVMGFSRGGNAALYSALVRFQEAYGPTTARITAHLPFYPICNFELERGLEVAGAPIREFHGGADDWTPAALCRDYIDRLAAEGHDAAMTIYPDALHGFDNEFGEPMRVEPRAQTSRRCRRIEIDGVLVNPETGAAFSYDDACVDYGPSHGYDPEAAAAAQAAVSGFLSELFALR